MIIHATDKYRKIVSKSIFPEHYAFGLSIPLEKQAPRGEEYQGIIPFRVELKFY